MIIMCLAIPAQIIQLVDDNRAIVCIGGINKEISVALLDEVAMGDYVIIHVGYALTRLNEAEAERTLQLMSEMFGGEAS